MITFNNVMIAGYMVLLVWLIYTFFIKDDDKGGSKDDKPVVIDGVKYKVGGKETLGNIQEAKPIKSLGSKLTCEILSKITGKPVYKNLNINNMDTIYGRTGGVVDCSEPLGGITVDYHNDEYYSFTGPSYRNSDINEYYNRMANDEYKKDQLSENNIEHIDVPYTVDMCETTTEGRKCSRSVPLNIRKQRIEKYLRDKLVA